ncbi:MAG TPA: FHA domain-containing protein [Acidimicrobiales bacterium]|nr:FHA domain-containing protein [Acidimicrobiales bacterium]
MSDSLLTILKFFLIALLWLFFLRVLRAVWSELKRPPVVTVIDEPRQRRSRRRDAPPPQGPASPTGAMPAGDGRGNGQVMRLRVLEPAEGRGRTFELGEEVTVGRASGCGVALNDAFTSQLHARVFRRNGETWIEDLGSTNGTFVNAKKLGSPVLLHPGDRLQVGRTVLEVGP